MFKQVFEKLKAEVSGDIAYNYVAEISRHHRIQASPGLRDAARFAVETWKAAGIYAEIHKILQEEIVEEQNKAMMRLMD